MAGLTRKKASEACGHSGPRPAEQVQTLAAFSKTQRRGKGMAHLHRMQDWECCGSGNFREGGSVRENERSGVGGPAE